MKIQGMIVPDAIVQAYQEYGFAKRLETALATTATDNSFSILFKDKGELYAVDFAYTTGYGWEVLSNYHPFDSIEEFCGFVESGA